MTGEVFRFVSVRAPRPVADGHPAVDPVIRRRRPTTLQQAVAELDGRPNTRGQARALAAEFLGSDHYLPGSQTAIPLLQRLTRLSASLARLPAIASGRQVADLVAHELGEDPARLGETTAFRTFEDNLWASLDANLLVPEHRPEDRDLLVTALRAVHLVRLLADPTIAAGSVAVHRLLDTDPLVPPDLFPRPDAPPPPRVRPAPSRPTEVLLATRTRLQAARDEVERLYRTNRERVLAIATSEPIAAVVSGRGPDRDSQVSNGGPPALVLRRPKPATDRSTPLWRLTRDELSAETVEALDGLGLLTDVDDVPHIVDRLNREIGTVNARLLPLVGRRTIRQVGASRIYHHEPIPQFFNVLAPPGVGDLVPVTPPAEFPAARPFRVLGIGDLILARETLLRYQPGEIAHIENILAGEHKDRVHRRKRQVEQITVEETERSELEERELESTDRFELQKESERVVQTDLSAGAGVSVSANYGYVSVTATGNFAYNNSRTESDASASTYARTVTDRALSRIEERTREQRTRRTLDEFEETNTHSLDGGQLHVRGVYQWVDKLYSMQLVNYGQRLMLEFVVPEPAAFYIFQAVEAPRPGAPDDEPIPPEDLGLTSHRVLNVENLPIFVTAYRVEDVEAAPAERTVVGKIYDQLATGGAEGEGEEGGQGPQVFTKADSDLVIPAGYRAGIAVVTYSAFTYSGISTGGYIHVGNNWIDAAQAAAGGSIHRTLNYEIEKLPVGLVVNDAAYLLTVEIECDLTAEKREEWQLATYAAIVAAYQARKAEFDERAARARVRQGVEISGRNPLLNRRIEREELKKSCISLLTGSRFEEPAQIEPNPLPDYHDLPEIAPDAVVAQAPRIQFLEQAFEWDQMIYQFYPYYWGRKQNWLTTFPLDDVDPKFADFLRAGAARVIVPVVPVYDGTVLLALASNEPFPGGATAVLDDPLFRSISAELRRQQGPDFMARDGTVNVRQGRRDVTGVGTVFTDDDRDREITIRGAVYRIQEVQSVGDIVLADAYVGADEDGVAFSVGPKLIDQPWTVRVPTALVYLRGDDSLPDPAALAP